MFAVALPSSASSPLDRRLAYQQGLSDALRTRNREALEQGLRHWAHRYGVAALSPLWAELAQRDPAGYRWFHHQPASTAPVVRISNVARSASAPAPRNPVLASLRAWLPDQQEPGRAA
jgi:hypothetical protein